MKKILRNLFFIAALFVLILGLAPRILHFDEIQKKITSQISKGLGSQLTIKGMQWVWLPLPHLTLVNTNITRADYSLYLPRINVYPAWRIILGQSGIPEKVLLDSPEIRIHKSAFQSKQPDWQDVADTGTIPEMPISIENGKVTVEFSEEYKEIFPSEALLVNDIRGSLKLSPREVMFDLHAASPVSKNINLKGMFNLSESAYRFTFDSRDIKLHKSVKALFRGSLLPVESTASISGTLIGKGLQNFEGKLHGTLPCFTVKPSNRETLLTCGYTDLKIQRSDSVFRLDINDLEIKDPQLNLSGYIERRIETVNGHEPSAASEPVWVLDLTGGDLDLTAIRQKILTLWPDNKIATKVCNIVRGGKALSAGYRFSGTAADFKRLDAMTIVADVLSADIQVPKTGLDLTRASGPIEIKNSTLSGYSLSAQLGNSYGRNGELFLDLDKQRRRFKLDIDIDADLRDLGPVLRRLVKHDGFQRQLSRFSEASGTASGSLHLGDSLKKVTTRVKVKTMAVEARYEPIPQKVFIENGRLDIEPGRVGWQKTSGRIGQQQISGFSGEVSWGPDMAPLLNITEVQAQLDGTSLMRLLGQTKVLPQQISTRISSLVGAIGITQGSLSGPASKPVDWKYEMELKAQSLGFTSPLLPETTRAENFKASVNNAEVNIESAAVYFLGQKINLNGSLKHHNLDNWYGTLEFNGPVKNRLAEWIDANGWFPDIMRPRVPFTMKNMRVRWQGEKVKVSGNILQGLDGGALPMAKIALDNAPEHLQINELVFYAPGEQGRLEFEFWRRSPKKFNLVWEGFVNADTIDALFEHSPLTAGNLSGDMEIQYFADQPEKSRFVGLLKTENLLLKSKQGEEPITLENLDINGIGRQLTIPTLVIAVGSEKISGSGQVLAEKEAVQIDINLKSSLLSKDSLNRLAAVFRESQNIFSGKTEKKPEIQLTREWNITGRIGFNFDTYILQHTIKMPYEGTQSITYTFHDIQGEQQLTPEKISRTEIFSARLCGLDFKGFLFSDAELGLKYQLFTGPDKTLRLENVLPCLGVQQDIIEGEFSMQASLLKESNIWYGGKIFLKSSQGRILRLKTLSRIFRVVNITDLFEEQVGSTGKRGFPFSEMDIDTHIEDNSLFVDRAIIRGEGLNLFARGQIGLADYNADLSLLIAPFKTFDTIISKVPIIGKPVMGEYGSRVNIPVAIKGPVTNPTITPLHPEAVGEAFLDIVKDTFMLPYNIILKPLEQAGENTGQKTPEDPKN